MTAEITATRLTRDAILLTGKVAIVTGGGAGIGRGIAIGLAEFGADVAIIDRDEEAAKTVAALIAEKGRRVLTINLDVRDREGDRAAVQQVISELGTPQILVNNVGGTRQLPLLQMTDAQMDKQVDLNLNSLFAMTQAAAAAMVAAGLPGSIINVASIEALRAAPGYSVYAACKAGMVNFTRTTALELSEYGIRVNAIAPDFVPTELMARFMPDLGGEQARANQRRYIPLGRAGNFDDCAGAAVFLASDMAAYVTGTTLSVDGGTYASSGWTRSAQEGRWTLY
ncbi:SDR family NAD(P)-dependent oxidoreductase [Haliea sp. E17]|uniref:SDR family NAD(P)-dependent oxidoreductase n=1 Tax=Haliea sp. E17 TaxID=3401576 RepID=UPI003AAD8998